MRYIYLPLVQGDTPSHGNLKPAHRLASDLVGQNISISTPLCAALGVYLCLSGYPNRPPNLKNLSSQLPPLQPHFCFQKPVVPESHITDVTSPPARKLTLETEKAVKIRVEVLIQPEMMCWRLNCIDRSPETTQLDALFRFQMDSINKRHVAMRVSARLLMRFASGDVLWNIKGVFQAHQ
ncbi:hypothetical protein BDW66DRAFT_123513 [Aspergillus desertorum]